MSQRIIVVDCDDVMINLRDTVIHALNHATGKNHHYRDFERFTSIGDDYGIGSKELLPIVTGKQQ